MGRQRLNEKGDSELSTRREILKRIVEFDSYAACWESDVIKVKGYVAEVQKRINVKDSFTKMAIERNKERQAHIEQKRRH